jgi:hypothetical protein
MLSIYYYDWVGKVDGQLSGFQSVKGVVILKL